MNEIEEFLEHYGVKGMKWGVRRTKKSGGSGKKSAKSRLKDEVEDISDEELKRAVSRMQLEKQYIELTRGTKSGGSGTKFANEIVKNAGKQEATKLVQKGMSVATGAALAAIMKKQAAKKKKG